MSQEKLQTMIMKKKKLGGGGGWGERLKGVLWNLCKKRMKTFSRHAMPVG